MIFEFTAGTDFDFLTGFAEQFGAPILDNELRIPEQIGRGNIKKIDLGKDFKLLIHQYTFCEEFVLKRKAPEVMSDFVTIVFYSSAFPNNFLSNREVSFTCTKTNMASVEVSSNDLNSEIRFPAGREIHFTVVGIKATLLAELMGPTEPNQVIRDRNQHQQQLFVPPAHGP